MVREFGAYCKKYFIIFLSDYHFALISYYICNTYIYVYTLSQYELIRLTFFLQAILEGFTVLIHGSVSVFVVSTFVSWTIVMTYLANNDETALGNNLFYDGYWPINILEKHWVCHIFWSVLQFENTSSTSLLWQTCRWISGLHISEYGKRWSFYN